MTRKIKTKSLQVACFESFEKTEKMKIIYKELFEDLRIITEKQATQLNYYCKIFIEGSIPKKVEIYKDQQLWSISHYLDDREDEKGILSEFYEVVDFVQIIERKKPLSGFYLEKERAYLKELPSDFYVYKRLYDENNRLISFQNCNKNNDPIHLELTEKYCYLPNTRLSGNLTLVDCYLEFSYNCNGELISMELYYGKDKYDEESELIAEFLTFSELESEMNISLPSYCDYYLDATFEI